ncbi:hypothetical protein BLAT2472_30455 [Burkholderia latens]
MQRLRRPHRDLLVSLTVGSLALAPRCPRAQPDLLEVPPDARSKRHDLLLTVRKAPRANNVLIAERRELHQAIAILVTTIDYNVVAHVG